MHKVSKLQLAWWLIAATLLLLSPVRTSAQEAPDVVRLANGGMLRGTIIEHDPSSHVRILLIGGAERVVDAAEVEWAGPASEMPTLQRAPAPPVPPPTQPTPPANPPPTQHAAAEGETVRISFTTSAGRVAVHRQTGELPGFRIHGSMSGRGGTRSDWSPTPEYSHLCDAPCDAELPVGISTLAVSRYSFETPRRLTDHFRVDVPREVRIVWNDRSVFRILGPMIWGLGGAAGAAGIITGTFECTRFSCREPFSVFLGAGIPLVILSFAAGIPLTFLNDAVSLESVVDRDI